MPPLHFLSRLVPAAMLWGIGLFVSMSQVSGGELVHYGVETRSVSDAGIWHTVTFREAFPEPPVVLVDDQVGETPVGTIELRSISVSGFDYRFSAVDPQAPSSALVRLGYLAAAVGDYAYGGLEWKVGKETLSSADPTPEIDFATSFSGVPVAVVRSMAGSDAGVSLVQTGASGLEFVFDFGGASPPPTLELGYIAVEAGSGSAGGRALETSIFSHPVAGASVAFSDPCPQPVIFAATQSNTSSAPLRCRVEQISPFGFDSILQDHSNEGAPPGGDEAVAYLALAQGQSAGTDLDTKLELGEIAVPTAGQWYPLTFSTPYHAPVLMVAPPSHGDEVPLSLSAPSTARVRIRNLTATGCEIRVEEPGSGDPAPESLYWMAMESGVFEIGGRRWEAGSLVLGEDGTWVDFSGEFPENPVLLAQVVTANNPDTVWAQPEAIGEDGIQISLAGTGAVAPVGEVIHYLAIEPGKGQMSPAAALKFEAKVLAPEPLHWSAWGRVRFSESYAAPYFFAHVQDNPDPVAPDLRQRNLSERKVDLSLAETLLDNLPRRIGLLLFGDTADRDEDGMPDAWEEQHNLDPDSAADATLDPDEDSLSNVEEFQFGTDPHKIDSDDDGAADHLEARSTLGFNPTETDSDGDGLGDGAEWRIINASLSDSYATQEDVLPEDDYDGDGSSNLDEQSAESDPYDYYNGAEPLLRAIAHGASNSGIPSFATAGAWLPHPVHLLVVDQGGQPLANAPVRFVVTGGSGLIAPASRNPAGGSTERILRTDAQGRIAIDWKVGSTPGEVQTLLACTDVDGKVQQRTFLAYSLAAGIPWSLSADYHFSAGRGPVVTAGQVETWHSLAAVPGFQFSASGGAPSFVAPTLADPSPWVRFAGGQFLQSPTGLPANSSIHLVVKPDAATSWQAPTGPNSQADALRGLAAQGYLLAGNLPVSGASPHVFHPYVPESPTAQYSWMSHYIHLNMLANGKYNPVGLGMHTGQPAHQPSYRYDVTDAANQGAYPNNVVKKRDQTLADTTGYYETRLANSTPNTQEWRQDLVQDFMNYRNANNVLIFKERKVRYRLWNRAVAAYWTYEPNQIAAVAPGLSAGTDGIAYFELNPSYAPQLGGWAAPSAGFDPSGSVVSFHLSGSGDQRLSHLGFDGAAPSDGLQSAGGALATWTSLGALADGTHGYSGDVGEWVAYTTTPSPEETALAEDRLAAHYRLDSPDRNADGLPDWWVRFLLGGSPAADDSDSDVDGLTLAQERAYGTHPLLADSDGDGLSDGGEIAAGTNPLNPDSDDDGIPDDEDSLPLDAANGRADADLNGRGDGLDQLVERLELDRRRDSDRDGDGVSDYAEWEVNHFINPDAALAAHIDIRPGDDFDSDGVTNLHESQDDTSLVDPDDYFAPVDFGRLLGSIVGADWSVDLGTGGIASSRLVRTAPSGLAEGVSHHEMRDGTRVRFQFLPPTSGNGAVHLGFSRRSRGVGDPSLCALSILWDGEGIARILHGGVVDPGVPSFPVSPSDLLELRLVSTAQGDRIHVEKNKVPILSRDLPIGFGPLGPWEDPLVLVVAPDTPGAGVHNLRQRRVHDPDSDIDELPDMWEQSIVAAFPSLYTNVADVFPDEDPDEDGLTNLQEYQTGTNPTHPDSDGDQMPDGWEMQHGLNPLADDADLDPDGDGLTHLQEFQAETHPTSPDTDGDGLWDGWEILHGFTPKSTPGDLSDAAGDPDADGLNTLEEFQLRNPSAGSAWTGAGNPRKSSTMEDGFSDGWKVQYGFSLNTTLAANSDPDEDGLTHAQERDLGTHPSNPDTDGDGMSDGWENAHGASHEPPQGSSFDPADALDPLDGGDAILDPDEDGLDNLGEYEAGTHPHLADSDGDGIVDGWEVDYGLDANDPGDADHDWDYDGLSALQEFALGTDPADAAGWTFESQSGSLIAVNEFDEVAAANANGIVIRRSGAEWHTLALAPGLPLPLNSLALSDQGVAAVAPATASPGVWIVSTDGAREAVPPRRGQRVERALDGGDFLLQFEEDVAPGSWQAFQSVFQRTDFLRSSSRRLPSLPGSFFSVDHFAGPFRNGTFLRSGRPFTHGLTSAGWQVDEEEHLATELYRADGTRLNLSEINEDTLFAGMDANSKGDVVGIAFSKSALPNHDIETPDGFSCLPGTLTLWRDGAWINTGLPVVHFARYSFFDLTEEMKGGLTIDPVWIDLAEDGRVTALVPKSVAGAPRTHPQWSEFAGDIAPCEIATELIAWEMGEGGSGEVTVLAEYEEASSYSLLTELVSWPEFISNSRGDVAEVSRWACQPDSEGFVVLVGLPNRVFTADGETRVIPYGAVRLTECGTTVHPGGVHYWKVRDADTDGMSDDWELFHGLAMNSREDADDDPDEDGLSNFVEYRLRSNPHSTDSDGDGLPDGWEYEFGFSAAGFDDPTIDEDGDGFDRAEEALYGSDPRDPENDRDRDGLSDQYEFLNHLSGDDATDALLDTDEDGLSNLLEYQLGTSAKDRDSDGDGVVDSLEVRGLPSDPRDSGDWIDYGGTIDLRSGESKQFTLAVPNTLGRLIAPVLTRGEVAYEGPGSPPDAGSWVQFGAPSEADRWGEVLIPVTISVGDHFMGGTVEYPFELRENIAPPDLSKDLIVAAKLRISLKPEIRISLSGDTESVAEGQVLALQIAAEIPPTLDLSEIEVYVDNQLAVERVATPESPLTLSTPVPLPVYHRYGESFTITARAYDQWGGGGPLTDELSVTVNAVSGSSDGDGLPDYWEQAIVDHDPDDALHEIADVGDHDDYDGDGIDNLAEYHAESDPTDPDENGDGHYDAWDETLDFEFSTRGETPFEFDAQGGLLAWSNRGLHPADLTPSSGAPSPVPLAFRSGAPALVLESDDGLASPLLDPALAQAGGWTALGIFEPGAGFFDPEGSANQTLFQLNEFLRVSGGASGLRLEEIHPDLLDPNSTATSEPFESSQERESWGIAVICSPPSAIDGTLTATLQAGPLPDWPSRTAILTLNLPARQRSASSFVIGSSAPPPPGESGDGFAARLGAWTLDDRILDETQLLHYFTTVAPLWRPGEPGAPEVEITAPSVDSRYPSPAMVHIEATIRSSDAPIASVAFYSGETLLAVDSAAPFEADWRLVGTGLRFLTARATDISGNTGTSPVRVILLRQGAESPTQPPHPPSIVLTGGSPVRHPFGGGDGGEGGGSGSGPNRGTSSPPDQTEADFDGDGRPDSQDWVPYDPRLSSWGSTGVPRFAVIETGEFIPWRSNRHGMVLGYVGDAPDVDSEWYVWYQGVWNSHQLGGGDSELKEVPTLSLEHPVAYALSREERKLGCPGDQSDTMVITGVAFNPEHGIVTLSESAPGQGQEAGLSIGKIDANGLGGSVQAVKTKDNEDGECGATTVTADARWTFAGGVSANWDDDDDDDDDDDGDDGGPDGGDPGGEDLGCYPQKKDPEMPESPKPGPKNRTRSTPLGGGIIAVTEFEQCQEDNHSEGGPVDPAEWAAAVESYNAKVDAWEEGDECPKFEPPQGGSSGEVEVPHRGDYRFGSATQPAVTDPYLQNMPSALRDPELIRASPDFVVATKGRWQRGEAREDSKCYFETGEFTRERRLLWLVHDGRNELVELRNGRSGQTVDVGQFSQDRTFTVGADGLGGLWADGNIYPWAELTGGRAISRWNWYVGRGGLSCAKSGTGGMILLPVEVVQGELGTEDEDVGNWLMAEADPKPEVEMSITDAQLSGDSLTISVQGTVKDLLSKYADNGSERVSSLRFLVDGEVIHSISLGDAVADGQDFSETVTIPNALPRGYTLRAETTENAAGNTGWDQVAVGLTLQSNQTGGGGGNITLSFSNPPTSGATDTVSVSGIGGTGTLTETAASSGEYAGTVNGENVTAFIGSAENLSDTQVEQIVAKVVFGGSAVHGTFEETGANTLTFEPSGYQGGGDTLTVGASIDLPGSQKEEFKPITFRVQGPDDWAESDDVKVKIGNTEYQLKEFSIGGTTALYPFDDQFPDEPKQFLPSENPVPGKLEVPQYSPGGGELPIKLMAGGSETDITSIQVERGTRTFADASDGQGGFSSSAPASQGWKQPGDTVTMDDLLTAYEWIYGGDDMAMILLEAFQDDNNIIRLKDVIGNLDVNWLFRTDGKIEIEIEHDDGDINPIVCANLLYAGLYRALAYPPLNAHTDVVDNWQLFQASREAFAQTAAEITATGAELYLSGIGIVLEPVDWVLMVHDVSEGQVASLAAALPFVAVTVVKAGRKLEFRSPDGDSLGELADAAQFDAIQRASRKRSFEDKVAILEEAGIDDKVIKLLVYGGEIQYSKARDVLKARMKRADIRPPSGAHQAHHDLPWEFREWFAAHKIDVNDAQYGRWVHVDDHKRWHNENPKFNDVWEDFIFDSAGNATERTKDEIIAKLAEIRSSYQVTQ